jgi:serine/threonine-protein kinase
MSYQVGDQIGQYIIMEQIGQGGMATVYKAQHPRLNRYVAIKVLHPALKSEEGFAARFEREAQLVASLQHPNIVTIFDFADQDGNPYLVMNFIEGTTLKAWLRNNRPSYDEILSVVESVGGALAFAHNKGVLHRDIKPSNIMIDYEGQIYLTDFGLARLTQAGESTLSQDMMLGTPQYISPEQAMGDRKLDTRTDIYSLGVVIYELIVGRVPFSADTPFAIVHDHIFTPLPAPTMVNPEVPQPVEDFLLKTLAKKRDERFPDVETMLKAFKVAMDHAGPEAVSAASQIVPRPYEEVLEMQRELYGDWETGSSAAYRNVGTEKPTEDATDSLPDVQARAKQAARKPRGGLWAITGLLLLILSLLGSGYLVYTVIIPEYERTFQQTETTIVPYLTDERGPSS